MNKQRSLTTSRLGRLTMMGRIAGGLAGGMVSEGARQLARGQRPTLGDALLTADNVRRLGDRLSEMRGAAMKVGQLLSMDSGEILPALGSACLVEAINEAIAKMFEGLDIATLRTRPFPRWKISSRNIDSPWRQKCNA